MLTSKFVEAIRKFSIGIRHLVLLACQDFSLAALKQLFTIRLFEGIGHLVGEFAGFDM